MAANLRNPNGTINYSYVPDFPAKNQKTNKHLEIMISPHSFLNEVRGIPAAAVGVYAVLLMQMLHTGRAVNMPVGQMARFCNTTPTMLKRYISELTEQRPPPLQRLDAGFWADLAEYTFTSRNRTPGEKG